MVIECGAIDAFVVIECGAIDAFVVIQCGAIDAFSVKTSMRILTLLILLKLKESSNLILTFDYMNKTQII